MKRKKLSLLTFTVTLIYILLSFSIYSPAQAQEVENAFYQSNTQAVYTSASVNQVNTIISTARSLIGSSGYNGYCQRFVRNCYEAAGIYANQVAFTALEGWSMWKVSTRQDNIPIGACVYFQGYGYSWEYGHVAIYLGNGYVIDATYQGVSERKITNWQGYLGWGYQAGIAPTGWVQTPSPAPTPPTTPPPAPARKLGDGNYDGVVSAVDARLCLRISAKLLWASQQNFPYYDVNRDGKITATDARLILRASAGLEYL